jgi:hypothetical protein
LRRAPALRACGSVRIGHPAARRRFAADSPARPAARRTRPHRGCADDGGEAGGRGRLRPRSRG